MYETIRLTALMLTVIYSYSSTTSSAPPNLNAVPRDSKPLSNTTSRPWPSLEFINNDLELPPNLSYFTNLTLEEDEDPTAEEFLEFIYPKSWTWALIFFHCVVFVVGLVGNCLVCVAVYRNHTMRTVTNYFIVNLAVADFLVILFCLPPSVVWDVTSTWWFGTAMCKIVLYLQVSG
ncbi:hypothetical protein NQ315_007245 [Exocentrus adspersus]|uniref:G-protein coupled receptors family 1 profile domain-containing protein n=1 Tax=Exocentrus adspersus TaxID=1586481 RepID=A0AAV8WD55_9CUCU|nr:hypothetical protein NQ315_007245 [Exocentrus adspersus]